MEKDANYALVGFSTLLLFTGLATIWPLHDVLPWLAVGPALGVLSLRPLLQREATGAPVAQRE